MRFFWMAGTWDFGNFRFWNMSGSQFFRNQQTWCFETSGFARIPLFYFSNRRNGHRSWCLIHPCMYVSDSDMWVMYLYHACIYTDKNLRYSRCSLFLFFWPLVALCHIGFCIQDFAIYSIGLFGPIYFFVKMWACLALGEQIADHPRSRGCVYGKFLFVYM